MIRACNPGRWVVVGDLARLPCRRPCSPARVLALSKIFYAHPFPSLARTARPRAPSRLHNALGSLGAAADVHCGWVSW